jgi:hypothetical protein
MGLLCILPLLLLDGHEQKGDPVTVLQTDAALDHALSTNSGNLSLLSKYFLEFLVYPYCLQS